MPRTILLTGAGHGFGRGTALGLARDGHRVVAGCEIWPQVWDLRQDARDEGLELEVIKLDMLDEIDRRHALGFDIDILVNNGGMEAAGPIAEIPLSRVRESFELNLFTHLELTQGFIPKMVARGSGKVVWMSSIGGIVAAPWDAAYCATKFAIEAVAWAMKEELAPLGITVATVNPGAFRTGFNDTGIESAGQWYDPRAALVKMPDQSAALEQQADPQEMIDEMVRIIPLESHRYRTVKPDAAVEQMKQFQAAAWDEVVGRST